MTDGILETAPRTRRGRPLWADAAVLGVAVVWGASYPVAKGALASAPVMTLILYRFAITGLVMTTVAWRDLKAAHLPDVARAATLGGILFLIFMSETFGVQRTSATNTAFLISLCTLLTPLLQFGLSRRAPPGVVVIGALISCCGTAVLSGGLTSLRTGDVLVLCAAGLRAVMVVSTKRLMHGSQLSSAALTAIQAVTVLILTSAALTVFPSAGPVAIDGDARFWLAIAFLALFCTIAAFYVQNAAVRRTSATRVAFLMGTEPVFGFLFASVLLGEPLSVAGFTGGGMILLGTFLGLTARP